MDSQLGFTWECRKSSEKVTCAAKGTDPREYAAHMRGHGTCTVSPSVAPIRLRSKAARVRPSFAPVEVPVFKFLSWTQHHSEQVECSECKHPERSHHCWHGPHGEMYACERCTCRADAGAFPAPVHHQVGRRGQFLSEGPSPHSVWVIPLEPAPWETGHPATVTLFVIEPGRYTTDYQEFRSQRRAVNRRTREAKKAAKAA
jgi:hypothetical protein